MPDILLKRQTLIYIAENDALFPEDILYPSDVLYPGVRIISNIVAGTLKLDEMLTEDTPTYGQMYATKFEVQVYFESDLSGKYLHVYQFNDGVYHAVFAGYVDSCKLDKVGTDRTLVAYDMSYTKRQLNVASWWASFWTGRTQSTLGVARNAMLDYLNIAHTTPTLINDNLVIKKDVDFTECSLQQMLSMMCELGCCFPHFNRSGVLTFITFDLNSTPTDLSGKYEWMNSDFEDFTTQQITGVQFYDSEDQPKYGVGTDGNAYPIKKNIFTYDVSTATLTTIGNNMLPKLNALVYTPATLKMIVGDFNNQLGDYVHTEKGNFFILQNSYSGSQFVEETIKSPGSKENYSQITNVNRDDLILNEKFARIHYSIEGLETEFGEIHSGLAYYSGNGYPTIDQDWNNTEKEQNLDMTYHDTTNDKYYRYQKIGSTYYWQEIPKDELGYAVISSQFKQTAQQISMKVSKGTVSSELSLEPGQITLSSGRLIINGGNFQLDAQGNITASNANLQGSVRAGTTSGRNVYINDGYIEFYNQSNLIAKIISGSITEEDDDEIIVIDDNSSISVGSGSNSSSDYTSEALRISANGAITICPDSTSSSATETCIIKLTGANQSEYWSSRIAMQSSEITLQASDNFYIANDEGMITLTDTHISLVSPSSGHIIMSAPSTAQSVYTGSYLELYENPSDNNGSGFHVHSNGSIEITSSASSTGSTFNVESYYGSVHASDSETGLYHRMSDNSYAYAYLDDDNAFHVRDLYVDNSIYLGDAVYQLSDRGVTDVIYTSSDVLTFRGGILVEVNPRT